LLSLFVEHNYRENNIFLKKNDNQQRASTMIPCNDSLERFFIGQHSNGSAYKTTNVNNNNNKKPIAMNPMDSKKTARGA
jgi:hypothetical protein